jgi:arabinogalactan oligomer/maltooligosaccharide transport system permease protein
MGTNFNEYLNQYLRILLIAFITAVFSTGCEEDKPKIVIWSSLRPVERTLLDTLLANFSTSYPHFEFGQLFYAPEEARTNFIISSLAGKGPAIIHGANDNIGPFVELDVIQPMEDLFDKNYLDQFLSEPLKANSWFRNHLYQIADRVGNHLCLVYNKNIIATPPQTMSELIAFGKNFCRDENGDGKPDKYALAWNYTEPFFAIPFIGGFGGWILNEKNEPTLNTEATIKAVQFIYDLANVYKIIPKECDYEISNALFKDNLSAMIINGPWSWGTYLNDGMNIGIARIPKIDETGLWPTPLVSPMGFSLNKNLEGEDLNVAVALIRYLTSEKVQLRFTKLSGSIPSLTSAYHDSLVTSNPFIQNAIDQMLVGRPMPVVTEMRWIFDAMRPGYQSIFTGRMTAKEAAADMQNLADKLIRENRE